MQFEIFTVNPFSENTYLIHDGDNAIVADPGFFSRPEKQQFEHLMDEKALQLEAILLTHAHVDHILGLTHVKQQYDVSVYMSHSDLYLWDKAAQQAAMFGFKIPDFDFRPEPLKEDTKVEIGRFTFKTYHTPGHAPEHLSFYFKEDNVLIAGDTLFKQSIGRTDLYKGDFEVLSESIKKLYKLPDETRVLPGHGPETTIGFEKKHNAYVREE